MNIYAIYKGDTFIDLGTLKYLAKKLNVSEKTIYFYSTEAYKKRRKYKFDNCYIVIKIGKENHK